MLSRQVKSVTTSIRFQAALRQSLEALAEESGRGMNWIIERALEEYIAKHRREGLLESAQKDIIYLNQNSAKHIERDESFWPQLYDDSDWES